MSRSIRSCVLVAAVVLLASGCSAFPFAAPALSDEVVLSVPSGEAGTVAEQLGHRLDVAQITEHSISTDGDTVTVRYNPPRKGGKPTAVRPELFQAAGVLGMRPVVAVAAGASASDSACTADAASCTAETAYREMLELGRSFVTNKHLRTAQPVDAQGQWAVQLDFTKDGAAALKTLTDAVACQDDASLQRFAILVDGKILTAPQLALECGASLGESAQIAGGLDRDDVTQLAALLSTPLPEGVTVVSSRP
ncbi:SecDF P1 head subdomain-containing protein [Microbacterium sp. NPDC089698]|uniref:SecDF P1 head subdomain-containing protein n=1 Tax=Microbacterium sp. NPDC089698 TaxID=3364200 RepID=UPI0037F1C1ED